ncbi:MAG: WYL domain-containing protein [Candidatus Omnitrophica bacterium]|nr:WYL domain-containing protein [Candidatus Omnitrophota bacterium]
MNDLKDKELVIFDLETTGLNPQEGDRICEIAGIKYKDDSVIDTFHSLIDPQRPISPAAYAINRIDKEMLKDAPKNIDVLPHFAKFISGTYLAAYNIRFDLNFLTNELKTMGKTIGEDILFFDILALARRTLLQLPSYSLANVANSLDLKYLKLHRALNDVRLSWNVLSSLLDILKGRGIKNFSEVYTLCGFNPDLLSQANEQKIAFILRAIDFRFNLAIRYFSKSSAQVTERNITPKEIYEEHGKKYLIGYCHLRNDERNFAIDSILHLDVKT